MPVFNLTSDLHNKKLISSDFSIVGDFLLISGDITGHMSLEEMKSSFMYIGDLPQKYKIITFGNHDINDQMDNIYKLAKENDIILLLDESINIDGISFYGTPWSYKSSLDTKEWSWNAPRSENGFRLMKDKMDNIPANTDILLTHCPPSTILDKNYSGVSIGCPFLMQRVEQIQPKIHLFGHVHESFGERLVNWENGNLTQFVNGSMFVGRGKKDNPIITLEIDLKNNIFNFLF